MDAGSTRPAPYDYLIPPTFARSGQRHRRRLPPQKPCTNNLQDLKRPIRVTWDTTWTKLGGFFPSVYFSRCLSHLQPPERLDPQGPSDEYASSTLNQKGRESIICTPKRELDYPFSSFFLNRSKETGDIPPGPCSSTFSEHLIKKSADLTSTPFGWP